MSNFNPESYGYKVEVTFDEGAPVTKATYNFLYQECEKNASGKITGVSKSLVDARIDGDIRTWKESKLVHHRKNISVLKTARRRVKFAF